MPAELAKAFLLGKQLGRAHQCVARCYDRCGVVWYGVWCYDTVHVCGLVLAVLGPLLLLLSSLLLLLLLLLLVVVVVAMVVIHPLVT